MCNRRVNFRLERSEGGRNSDRSIPMELAMAVSGVGSSVNIYVPQPPAAKVVKQPPTADATVTTSTPSVAATTPSSPTPPAAAPASTTSPAAAPAPAPKVDPIKLAIKESTEPVTLLTQQAKHGDVVAKMLLKQINQKAAAKQAAAAKPQTAPASEAGKGEVVDHKA
jgi:hypothetical protein